MQANCPPAPRFSKILRVCLAPPPLPVGVTAVSRPATAWNLRFRQPPVRPQRASQTVWMSGESTVTSAYRAPTGDVDGRKGLCLAPEPGKHKRPESGRVPCAGDGLGSRPERTRKPSSGRAMGSALDAGQCKTPPDEVGGAWTFGAVRRLLPLPSSPGDNQPREAHA